MLKRKDREFKISQRKQDGADDSSPMEVQPPEKHDLWLMARTTKKGDYINEATTEVAKKIVSQPFSEKN